MIKFKRITKEVVKGVSITPDTTKEENIELPVIEEVKEATQEKPKSKKRRTKKDV